MIYVRYSLDPLLSKRCIRGSSIVSNKVGDQVLRPKSPNCRLYGQKWKVFSFGYFVTWGGGWWTIHIWDHNPIHFKLVSLDKSFVKASISIDKNAFLPLNMSIFQTPLKMLFLSKSVPEDPQFSAFIIIDL